MPKQSLMGLPTYNPTRLIEEVSKLVGAKSDAALARRLHVAAPTISKIRGRHLPLRASVLIRMHEESGISIRELRELAGDSRRMWA